ncbi:hypothetical protein E0H73_24205 [Kribbella pittospori]|uniref:Uncharacterized protein n=1 Tax=Kribbella pittospori TaxID=722689 RepID=A0A4R0KKJ8_9ACTN|nr:hypothetical protein [Kribbella pittospori]TCC59724.1 hypothetical protein E0H73_24205 [Kribbella pittospori]
MSTVEQVERRPWVVRRWPAAAGIAAAAFAGWGIEGGADVAAIVTASGFVYLGSAALQRRNAAWPVFAVSFVAVGVGTRVEGVNATWVMLALAAVLAVYGVLRGALRPPWGMPLQAAALVVLAAAALVAVQANQTLAGLLVAAGLFFHACWDTYHHRTRRVVALSMAEFCAVLDTLLAIVVLVVTFA